VGQRQKRREDAHALLKSGSRGTKHQQRAGRFRAKRFGSAMRMRCALGDLKAFATGNACDMTFVCARIERTRRHIASRHDMKLDFLGDTSFELARNYALIPSVEAAVPAAMDLDFCRRHACRYRGLCRRHACRYRGLCRRHACRYRGRESRRDGCRRIGLFP